MRDPARIPLILKAIEEAWMTNPDMRFYQLIGNIPTEHDPYYVEDDVFMLRLNTTYRRAKA